MPPAKAKSDYIETDTGNKVARKAQLHGTQHIILGGRVVTQPNVCIRGDLVRSAAPAANVSTSSAVGTGTEGAQKTSSGGGTSISIGRYTFVSQGATLRPPYRMYKGLTTFHPLKIGEHVYIGPNATIEAASIGDHVHIGAGTVVGRMAIIKDWVKILEGCVVPAGMVVASGSVIGGRPGRMVGELGDGWGHGDGVEGGDLRELWRAVG